MTRMEWLRGNGQTDFNGRGVWAYIISGIFLTLLAGCMPTGRSANCGIVAIPGYKSSAPKILDVPCPPPGTSTSVAAEAIFYAEPLVLDPGAKWVFDWKTIKRMDENHSLGAAVHDINQMPPDNAWAYLSGKTLMTFRNFHGTQIEYFHPVGDVHLWHPGNSRTVDGDWQLVARNKRYKICFRYDGKTIKSVTLSRYGKSNCMDLVDISASTKETRTGDIFNLTSGSVPFSLSPEATKFDALLTNKYTTRGQKNAAPMRALGKYIQKYTEALRLLDEGEDRQSSKQAIALLMEAAQAGFAPAQLWFSIHHSEGSYVTRNDVESAKWADLTAYHAQTRRLKIIAMKRRNYSNRQLTPQDRVEAKIDPKRG